MKTGVRVILVVSLVLIGASAWVLARMQSGHHLGAAGLRFSSLQLTNEVGEVVTTNSLHLPSELLNYQSQLIPVTKEEYTWLPRDTTYGRRMYTAPDGHQIQVSGVLMGMDRTSIHKPEYCLPAQGFQLTSRSKREILIDRPHRYALPVSRLDALREIRRPDGGSDRRGAVYVYWFLSDSRLSNDHLQRMWWLASDLVRTGELQRWAYMGALTACPPGLEDVAYERLERFIQSLVPEIQLTTGPALSRADLLPAEPALPVPMIARSGPSPDIALRILPQDGGVAVEDPLRLTTGR